MDIRAMSVTGRVYSLSAGEGASVSSLKEDLSVLTGLTADQLELVSGSCLLRDPVSLSAGQEIQLLTKVCAGVLIYIKTLQGNTITIEVAPQFDTVENLKNKIEDKSSMFSKEQMLLVYGGRELRDADTLASCGIDQESTINLVLKGKRDSKTSSYGSIGRGEGRGEGGKTGGDSWCCAIL